jgi:hypothetical protein
MSCGARRCPRAATYRSPNYPLLLVSALAPARIGWRSFCRPGSGNGLKTQASIGNRGSNRPQQLIDKPKRLSDERDSPDSLGTISAPATLTLRPFAERNERAFGGTCVDLPWAAQTLRVRTLHFDPVGDPARQPPQRE